MRPSRGNVALALSSLLAAVAALVIGLGEAQAAFGDAWSEVGANVLPATVQNHTTARFGDTLYVIGGRITGSDTPSQKVYSSSDAESWSEVGTDVLPADTFDHCTVVFDSKLWVIGGRATVGGAPSEKVYSSSDASSWSEVGTDALPRGVFQAACTALDGAMYVIGGRDNSDRFDEVLRSEDGETWTEVGTLPEALSDAGAQVLDGTIYVIGGTLSGSTASQKVFSSADGSTWAELGEDVLPTGRRFPMTGMASGQLWLAGGMDDNGDEQSDVYSSEDGENWSEIGDDALPAARRSANDMPLFNGMLHIIGGVDSGGNAVDTVYATDDVAGAAALPEADTSAQSGAADISALGDQSGDTGQGNLPVVGPIAQEVEDDTGYPVLKFVWVLIATATIIGSGLLVSRVAGDHPVLPAIAVIVMTAIWWQVGQGDIIPWAVLVSVAFLTIGITTFTTRTPA